MVNEVESANLRPRWLHHRRHQVSLSARSRARTLDADSWSTSDSPTGSTGYGQEFCDRIKNQWGGYPYQDLVAGLEFVKENVSKPALMVARKLARG